MLSVQAPAAGAVGALASQLNILFSAKCWLTDDYRGWKKVTDRRVLRETVDRWIATHRYLG